MTKTADYMKRYRVNLDWGEVGALFAHAWAWCEEFPSPYDLGMLGAYGEIAKVHKHLLAGAQPILLLPDEYDSPVQRRRFTRFALWHARPDLGENTHVEVYGESYDSCVEVDFSFWAVTRALFDEKPFAEARDEIMKYRLAQRRADNTWVAPLALHGENFWLARSLESDTAAAFKALVAVGRLRAGYELVARAARTRESP